MPRVPFSATAFPNSRRSRSTIPLTAKDKFSFYWQWTRNGSQRSLSQRLRRRPAARDRESIGTYHPCRISRLNYDRTINPTLLLHLGGSYFHIMNFATCSVPQLQSVAVRPQRVRDPPPVPVCFAECRREANSVACKVSARFCQDPNQQSAGRSRPSTRTSPRLTAAILTRLGGEVYYPGNAVHNLCRRHF